jgi:hypothetical protein
MSQEIQACDNEICIKKDECLRYKLFINGQEYYKTFNGKPHKGCGQFIEIKEK